MIDETDLKILNALLSNSRASTTKIASQLNISNVATQARINKMEKLGIIKSYTAQIDYNLIDYKTTAYIGIYLEKAKNYPEVLAQLEQVPYITEAHFTTGTYSIFAKILAKDNLHLMEILSQQIQNIDGIARTETFISLNKGIHKSMQLT